MEKRELKIKKVDGDLQYEGRYLTTENREIVWSIIETPAMEEIEQKKAEIEAVRKSEKAKCKNYNDSEIEQWLQIIAIYKYTGDKHIGYRIFLVTRTPHTETEKKISFNPKLIYRIEPSDKYSKGVNEKINELLEVENKAEKKESMWEEKRIEALNDCAPEWFSEIQGKLGIQKKQDQERKRFLEKFGFLVKLPKLPFEDKARIKYYEDNISHNPYLRIKVLAELETDEINCTLKFVNKRFSEDIGKSDKSVYEDLSETDFSDARYKLANWLAEKVKGKIKRVNNWDNGVAYLNVVVGNDTIKVASIDLDECDY